MKLLPVALLLFMAAPVEAGVERWDREIGEASARVGVPAEWIRRVMKAESGGRLSDRGRPITSRAGAMGLMQLMPATWAELRSRYGLGSDPYAPRDNIIAGAAYLRLMYDRFGYPGLFAAYNAGPKRYADYLAGRSRLPRETVNYLALTTRRGETSVRRLLLDRDPPVPGAAQNSPVPADLFAPSGAGQSLFAIDHSRRQ